MLQGQVCGSSNWLVGLLLLLPVRTQDVDRYSPGKPISGAGPQSGRVTQLSGPDGRVGLSQASSAVWGEKHPFAVTSTAMRRAGPHCSCPRCRPGPMGRREQHLQLCLQSPSEATSQTPSEWVTQCLRLEGHIPPPPAPYHSAAVVQTDVSNFRPQAAPVPCLYWL